MHCQYSVSWSAESSKGEKNRNAFLKDYIFHPKGYLSTELHLWNHSGLSPWLRVWPFAVCSVPTLFAACLEIHSCKMKNREKRHVNLVWESWRRGERLRRTGWLCIFYTKFSLILISPIQWTKHEPNNQILLKPCASPVIDFRILIKTLMCPSISRW